MYDENVSMYVCVVHIKRHCTHVSVCERFTNAEVHS